MDRKERGMGLVEVLVGIGIIGVLTLSMSSLMTQLSRQQRKFMVTSTLMNLRNSIHAAINNETLWPRTLAANSPTMDSLLRFDVAGPELSTSPTTDDFFPVTVLMASTGDYDAGYTSDGDVLVDASESQPRTARHGFDSNGRKCETFDAGVGNDNCPFRFVVEWRPNYTGDPLTPEGRMAPGIDYRVRFFYRPGPALVRSGIVINEAQWSIAPTVRRVGNDLVRACAALGGTWDPAALDGRGECSYETLVPCGPGTKMIGTERDGQPRCVATLGDVLSADPADDSGIDARRCPLGQKQFGMNPDGSIRCVSTLDGAALGGCTAGQKVRTLGLDGTPVCTAMLAGLSSVAAGQTDAYRCPVGKRMIGIDDGGRAVCTTVVGDVWGGRYSCPANESVVRINDDGTVICAPHDRTVSTCAAGYVLHGVQADGTPRCVRPIEGQLCGPGYIFRGMVPGGPPICDVDRTFTPGSCPAGQVLRGYRADGSRDCVARACPSGQISAGTRMDGSLECVDRTVDRSCHYTSFYFHSTQESSTAGSYTRDFACGGGYTMLDVSISYRTKDLGTECRVLAADDASGSSGFLQCSHPTPGDALQLTDGDVFYSCCSFTL